MSNKARNMKQFDNKQYLWILCTLWTNLKSFRMIRQSDATSTGSDARTEDRKDKMNAHKDSALWAPTGWVHVEKDIDFSDPKVAITSIIFFL